MLRDVKGAWTVALPIGRGDGTGGVGGQVVMSSFGAEIPSRDSISQVNYS
jgi:hypothetical protein